MTFLKRRFVTIFCFLLFIFVPLECVLKLLPHTGEDYSVFRNDYIEQLKDFKTQILLTLFCSLQVNFKTEIPALKEEISQKVKMEDIIAAQVTTYNSLVCGPFKKYIIDPSWVEQSFKTCFDGGLHTTLAVDIDYAQLFARHIVNSTANVCTIYLLLNYLNYVDLLLNELQPYEHFCFKNITPCILGLFLILKEAAFSVANFSYYTSTFNICNNVKLSEYESILLEKIQQREELCVPTQVFVIYVRMLLDINKRWLAQLVGYFKQYPTLEDCLDNCKKCEKNHLKQILNFDSSFIKWGVGAFQNFLEIKLKEDLMHVLVRSFPEIRFDVLNSAHIGFMNFAKDFEFNVIYKWIKFYSLEPCNELLFSEKYDKASAYNMI